MPEMNGGEFLREVSQRWPDAVRIVLSGYADIAAVISAINDGAIFKFVAKPWQENELKDVVSEAIAKHRALVQMRQMAERSLETSDELFARSRRSDDTVMERHLALESIAAGLEVYRNAFTFASAPMLIMGDNKGMTVLNEAARLLFADAPDTDNLTSDSQKEISNLLENGLSVLNDTAPVDRTYAFLNSADKVWRARFARFQTISDEGRVVVVLCECPFRTKECDW
jgi:hypothetical protein